MKLLSTAFRRTFEPIDEADVDPNVTGTIKVHSLDFLNESASG